MKSDLSAPDTPLATISSPARPSRAVRRMLRTKEAAEYLAVSEWKIRQLFHTGEVPYIQNGQGAVTVDVKDLDGYIERNKRVS